MLKKVTLGLIAALGVSASALAAGPGADVPIPAAPASINVTAPVQQGSWEIGLEGGFVQPGNSNFQYAQRSGGSDEFRDYSVQPSHQWTGHADVRFNIPGAGRFVELGGSYFNASDSDRVSENTSFSSGGLVHAPLLGLADDILGTGYDNAKGSSSTSYTDVDLVFGQKVDVGARLRLEFFGGLRYASIDGDDKGTYTNHDASGVLTEADTLRLDSDFSGIGPRAGINTEVNLAYGWSIVGTIAGSLLVGDLNAKDSLSAFTPGSGTLGDSTEFASWKSTSDVRVIPEADARIGLHYNYDFNPETSMGLEVGYEVENYFGAVDKDAWDMLLPNTVKNDNDFGFQGPYLRVQVNLA